MSSVDPQRDGAIDSSPTPAEKQLLHRRLQDDSGLDYYLYVPQRGRADAPLVVVVHDISRDAEAQARAFTSLCDRYGANLVAPRFASDRYPNYQRLGRSHAPDDSGRGADDALTAIVEEATALAGASKGRVHVFGHAAGGRFAMRYAMAHPDRVAASFAAAADRYTHPDPKKRFPRGIAPGQKRNDLHFEPERFLHVPMHVLEASSGRVRRLERVGGDAPDSDRKGVRSWVEAMREAARGAGIESGVSYHEVAGTAASFDDWVNDHELPARVFEALLGPLPGEPARFTDNAVRDPAQPAESHAGRRSRKPLALVAVAAIVAVAAPLLLWAQYRAGHVLSRDAVVRSHIADVGTRLDGVVKTVEVDAGDRVRAGQVVARLEDSHFEAKLRQARSQLEKASRELEVERLAIENERQRLEGALREVSAGLSVSRAQMRASWSQAREAQRRLDLQRSLAAKGLVAEEQVRAAETEVRTARALAAAAEAELAAAGAGEELAQVESDGIAVREKRVSVLESEIAALRAEVAVAEANLEGTVIRAPDDGAVVRRIVQPGGSAGVGQPILSLWVGEELWVEAWVDESDLGDVAVGSPATVTFESYPDREFAGIVERLGVSTDFGLPDTEVPQPRNERMRNAPLISARIRLEDTEADLFPGLSATVAIRKQAR